jgi:hypothetical protein
MASIINASTSGAGGVITTADASGQLELQTAGVTRQTIDVNGNVGIGTGSPGARLDINGNLLFSSSSSPTIYCTGSQNLFVQVNTGATIFTRSNGSSESMRIDSSGNLLVATTTNPGTPGKIVISGNSDGTFNPMNVVQEAAGSTSRTSIQFYRNSASAVVGNINTTNTATSYGTSSDYRLKENIAPMTGALDTVAQLKPVTYNWKVDGSNGQGFIAHELAEVVPDCVTGEKDAVDAEGNPVYQGIDTSFLVATLTAAIQELKARLEVLEGASA